MSSDLGVAAINLAIETTTNALAVEQENNKLHDQLKKNLQFLDEFDTAAPRVQRIQKQLKEKESILEQKRKDLIEIQTSIISTLKNQSQEENVQPSFESIPVVMNRVQRFVTDLTEAAVDQKTIAVPIIQLFKVTEALNKLYDALVDTKVIAETQEEKEVRIKNYVDSQQDILTKLRAIVKQSQDAANAQAEQAAQQPLTQPTQPQQQQAQEPTQNDASAPAANRPPTPEPDVPPTSEVGTSPVAETQQPTSEEPAAAEPTATEPANADAQPPADAPKAE